MKPIIIEPKYYSKLLHDKVVAFCQENKDLIANVKVPEEDKK